MPNTIKPLQQQHTIQDLLNNIPGFNEIQRAALSTRYIQLFDSIARKRRIISIQYNSLRYISTIGSLIIPALLSIQYVTRSYVVNDMTFFLVVWIISFLVTLSNGSMSMFKLDRRYVSLHTAYELLHSEGWQFIQLGGRYSHSYTEPTHANQLLRFIHRIESIKMKTVEDEFHFIQDADTIAHQHTLLPKTIFHDSLMPITPMTSIGRQSRKKKRFAKMISDSPNKDIDPIILTINNLNDKV